MHDDSKDKERDREPLIAAIEVEIADILVREHGMHAVQVFLDRETGDIVGSCSLPDELEGSTIALAAKRAIIKRAREREDRAE